ncbi:ImmA/IrrE family metallo-endopeptidase [Dehalococcoides sp.]|uniref:ImmA/IrrE family metallo-endopeptidase n=1 Tax=Dehalococcoides sp. TaxID=1966486 RepID=UPI002ACB0A7C|nr:ImmA/IrrE family metallo-endopeptidase [Dehalococcoides sp.]
MKQYRGPDGKQRIWFESSEIECVMEDELNKAGLYPTSEQPIVDIERFLENHLRAKVDQYADLEKDILGVTSFTAGQNPTVEINKDLTGAVFDQGDDNVSLLGRWRATLAHEGSHIILHRPLFELSTIQGDLFREVENISSKEVVIKCYKKNVGFSRGRTDWREFQANRGMAALLMPQHLLKKITEQLLKSHQGKLLQAGSKEAYLLITTVSEIFQVSRQAAEIRLNDLGTLIPAGQALMKVE